MTWLDKHRKIVNVSTIIISYRGSLIRLEGHPAISPEDPKTLLFDNRNVFLENLFLLHFVFFDKKEFCKIELFLCQKFLMNCNKLVKKVWIIKKMENKTHTGNIANVPQERKQADKQ